MNSKACRYVGLLVVVLLTCAPVYSFQIGGGGSSGGVSGGGTVTGSGTPDQVTKWDSTGTGITDSLLTSDTSRVRNTGGWQDKITTSSTNLTLDATHNTVYSTTGAADKTYTLPSANGLTGQVYHVYKVDSGIGGVIIAPNGSDTINGTNAATTHITCQHCGFDIKWESNVGWQVSSVVKLPPYFLYSNDSTGLLTGLDPTSVGCVQSDGTSFTVGSCGGSGSSLLQTAAVPLSANDIKTLFSVPVTLVPAQGSNTLIVPIEVTLHWIPNTTPFSSEDQKVTVNYRGQVRTIADTHTFSVDDATAYPNEVFTASVEQDALFQFVGQSRQYHSTDAVNADVVLTLLGPDADFGSIITSSLASGGSGYAPGDTFYVIDSQFGIPGSPYGAFGTVDTVDGGGAVLTYHLTDNGLLYKTALSPYATAKQSGSGDDAFTINVDSISIGDGSAIVTITYYVVDSTTGNIVAGTPPGGSGTAGFIPKWTGSTTLGNSQWYDSGSKLLANSTTPGSFDTNTLVGINGQLEVQGLLYNPNVLYIDPTTTKTVNIAGGLGASTLTNFTTVATFQNSTNGWYGLTVFDDSGPSNLHGNAVTFDGTNIAHINTGNTFGSPSKTLNGQIFSVETWSGYTGSFENPGMTLTVSAHNDFDISQDAAWELVSNTSTGKIAMGLSGLGAAFTSIVIDSNGVLIAGLTFVDALKTTGSATGKNVVCVDTSTGRLYASSTGVDCSN